jgi:hypothetical protein
MTDIPKITTVEYGFESESLQMTEETALDWMSVRYRYPKTLDDKTLNRSPLGIAMNIGFGSDHTFKE